MVSRFELAPWIITIGGAVLSRGPMSSTLSAAPDTSIIRPCSGKACCSASTPACVISARIPSAITTTTKLMRNVLKILVLKILATKELRFYRATVSQPMTGHVLKPGCSSPAGAQTRAETEPPQSRQLDCRPPQIDADHGAQKVDFDALDPA